MAAGDVMIDGEGPYVPTGYGVAHPWLCDAMGHLTTRHYVGFFDDASWHLLAELGYRKEIASNENWGWADVRNEITYLGEVSPGTVVRIASRIVAIGTRSLRIDSVMQDRSDGRVTARMTADMVCFDLKARKSKPLPESIRTAARARFHL